MRNLIEYSQNYDKLSFEDIQVAYRKKMVIELIKAQKHRNILEVGCGLDPFYNYFNDFEKLVIVEPSNLFYTKAQNTVSKSKKLSNRVVIINNYLESSISQLHNYDFDYIMISCLLHEIENPPYFLEKIRCISKKNTVIHIDVPNAFSFHRVLAKEMGLIKSEYEMSVNNIRFQQQRVFDLTSLSNLIQEEKFKIISSGSYFVKPFTHEQMSFLVENKIIDKEVLEGLFKMIKYMPNLGSEIYLDCILDD
jgi:ubiquinone/menaquinone biosynthesis C-methylase UbiE